MASQIDNVHRQRHARLLHLVKFGFVEFLFHCVWSHSHSKSTGGWKKWFWALQKIFSRVASYQLTIGLPCDDSPEKERIENPTSPAHRTESHSHLHYKGGFKRKRISMRHVWGRAQVTSDAVCMLTYTLPYSWPVDMLCVITETNTDDHWHGQLTLVRPPYRGY